MMLSDTKVFKIGFDENGNLNIVESFTLEQMQGKAGVTDTSARDSLLRLSQVLREITQQVPEGRQALITLSESTKFAVYVQPEGSFDFPVISSYIRDCLRETLEPREQSHGTDDSMDVSLAKDMAWLISMKTNSTAYNSECLEDVLSIS